MFWAPSEEGTELRWIIYVTLPMHPDVRTVATIPEEAIKRLRSLERLDESPFLRRISLRAVQGDLSCRSLPDTSGENLWQSIGKRSPAVSLPGHKCATLPGKRSRHLAAIDKSKRPRELPWLVTPAPSPSQALYHSPARGATHGVPNAEGGSGIQGNIIRAAARGLSSIVSASMEARMRARAGHQRVVPKNALPTGAMQRKHGGDNSIGEGVGPKNNRCGYQHDREEESCSIAGVVQEPASLSCFHNGAIDPKLGGAEDPESTSIDVAEEEEREATERTRRLNQALALACQSCSRLTVPVAGRSPLLKLGSIPSSLSDDSQRGVGHGGRWKVHHHSGNHSAFRLDGVILPLLPSLRGLPSRKRDGIVRAAAWLRILKMAIFADKLGRVLSESNRAPALPLGDLETELLELRPFHFQEAIAEAAKQEHHSAPLSPGPRGGSEEAPTSLANADDHEEHGKGAQGDPAAPSHVTPTSAGEIRVLTRSPRSKTPTRVGWKRGLSRVGRSRSASPPRRNPLTTWGGAVISPALPWPGSAISTGTTGQWRSPCSPFRDSASGNGGLGFPIVGDLSRRKKGGRETEVKMPTEFVNQYFRTVDGRSLFAESLATSEGTLNAFEASTHAESLGTPNGGLGLGLKARQRRGQLDSRTRDGKRRAERIIVQERVERVNAESSSGRKKAAQRPLELAEIGKYDRVPEDRAKFFLGLVMLQSRTVVLKRLWDEAKAEKPTNCRNEFKRASSSAMQCGWRSNNGQTPGVTDSMSGAIQDVQRKEELLIRAASSFIVCTRARIVALLRMWPEGEAGVKVELRTGKRISSKTSARIASERGEIMPLCPALKTPKGVARNGSIDGAGKSRGSALWLPQLVQKMEGRRVDTMLNLQKGKDKILRHRQANERVGREEEAREKSPRRSQSLESCGNPALAIYLASSINSTNGAATRRKGTPIISSREGARSPPAPEARQGTSHERVATVDDDDLSLEGKDCLGSLGDAGLPRSSRSRTRMENKQKERRPDAHKPGLSQAESGCVSPGQGLEEHEVEGIGEGSGVERLGGGVVFGTGGGVSGRARSSVGQTGSPESPSSRHSGTRGTSRGGAGTPSSCTRPIKNGPVRDMTSSQLLIGSGWSTRVSELANDLDASPLVPLAVKLATIVVFLRAERSRQRLEIEETLQTRSLATNGQATIQTVKTLLHGTLEDFVNQMEAAHGRHPVMNLQLYSGAPRARFKVEVDRKVRAHLDKANRRAGLRS